jgi:hypothetical protein
MLMVVARMKEFAIYLGYIDLNHLEQLNAEWY